MLLKELSYYKTGGTCDQLIEPSSIEELAFAMENIHRDETPYFLLGAGSNSLIMDGHWPGAVVSLRKMRRISITRDRILAEAGVDNSEFASHCLDAALEGAGWLYGMPGQLGATIRMNARCYGGEIDRIVDSVTVVTAKGEVLVYPAKEVFRGYKSTLFMSTRDVVAAATFTLKEGDPQRIGEFMRGCKSDREGNFQFLHPSCGCVFKNDYDVGVPSGFLLEQAAVRRFNTGSVEISPHHANFVFNKGASTSQILDVTLKMREAVYRKFGVWLEYEMEVLGIVPHDLKERLREKRPDNYRHSSLAPLREQFRKGVKKRRMPMHTLHQEFA